MAALFGKQGGLEGVSERLQEVLPNLRARVVDVAGAANDVGEQWVHAVLSGHAQVLHVDFAAQ